MGLDGWHRHLTGGRAPGALLATGLTQQQTIYISDVSTIIEIESKVTANRFDFDFLNFVPSSIFFIRLVITGILCTTVLFALAIVLKYDMNCS
jgi:hypothetical protein